MAVTVRIPVLLRAVTGGKNEIEVEGATVKDVLSAIEPDNPGFLEKLYDEEGNLRRFINIYVNGEDIRFSDGEATALKAGDEISIVPAIAGGAW